MIMRSEEPVAEILLKKGMDHFDLITFTLKLTDIGSN